MLKCACLFMALGAVLVDALPSRPIRRLRRLESDVTPGDPVTDTGNEDMNPRRITLPHAEMVADPVIPVIPDVPCIEACTAAALISSETLRLWDKTSPINSYTCYATLQEAVSAAVDGSFIQITHNITISTEIAVEKSLWIVGCGRRQTGYYVQADGVTQVPFTYVTYPGILTNMNVADGTVLRVTAAKQNITFANINFANVGGGMGSAIRTWERSQNAEWSVGSQANVTITNCNFTNFLTGMRGGSAIYFDTVSQFVLQDSSFVDNRVLETGEEYDGSGAVWIIDTAPGSYIRVSNCSFARNKHEFQHGLGAGFGIDSVYGKMEILGCNFRDNNASGGAALYVQAIRDDASVLVQDSWFFNNTAWEYGWGSRGGAMWVQFIDGNLDIINTQFVNNEAPADRGGAIANNIVRAGAKIKIDGCMFRENISGKGASVWDTLNGFKDKASLTFTSTCEFEDNMGEENSTMLVRLGMKESNGDKGSDYYYMYRSDWKWKDMDFFGYN